MRYRTDCRHYPLRALAIDLPQSERPYQLPTCTSTSSPSALAAMCCIYLESRAAYHNSLVSRGLIYCVFTDIGIADNNNPIGWHSNSQGALKEFQGNYQFSGVTRANHSSRSPCKGTGNDPHNRIRPDIRPWLKQHCGSDKISQCIYFLLVNGNGCVSISQYPNYARNFVKLGTETQIEATEDIARK